MNLIAEAKSWYKLHSLQAVIIVAVVCAIAIFVPGLMSLAQLAIFVLVMCAVIFVVRLIKQNGLVGSETYLKAKVGDITGEVGKLFGHPSTLPSASPPVAPFGMPASNFKADPAPAPPQDAQPGAPARSMPTPLPIDPSS